MTKDGKRKRESHKVGAKISTDCQRGINDTCVSGVHADLEWNRRNE